jgi:fucose permease
LVSTLSFWGKNKLSENNEERKNVQAISFRELFRTAGVKQILAAFFCYCSIELTAGLWGSSFLVIEKNISPEKAAQWISLYYIGITFGRFISGFLSMRLSNRQMVRLGQALVACGIIALLLPFGNVLLLPGFFIIGLGCAPIYPSLLHETPKNFGEEKSQALIGIQMASAYIGSMFIPPLFGGLASFSGFYIFPFFLAVILIIKIIMVESLNKKVDKCKV